MGTREDEHYEQAKSYGETIGAMYRAADIAYRPYRRENEVRAAIEAIELDPEDYGTTQDDGTYDLEHADHLADDVAELIDSDTLDVTVKFSAGISSYVSGSLNDDAALDSIDVLLATGGPAYGVEVDANGRGRFWFQDWFTSRIYPVLTGEAHEGIQALAAYWNDYAGWTP